MKQLSPTYSEILPRERLILHGATNLTDSELLAIILGSGGPGRNVFSLAEGILPIIDAKNGGLKPSDLSEIDGIGSAKATSIVAALEFARRRIRPEGTKIREPSDIWPLVRHIGDRKQEHFICVSLNGAHEVIATRTVTIGLLNASQVHPREVYAEPLTDRACSIIVAHNHPSGVLEPSKEDIEVTKRLAEAGKILGIKLLDHVIFSHREFLSLKDRGILN